ncbi:hypothetical protein FAZ15_19280 [Sphingobacterium olei]|uniref:Uncharacterized protein n=1 Tax=Sphingobacterium olei TaxID=2571155 RepID=A0A4U0NG38_9SPHI|nr:DUF6695 family protein [Sphingobacterium olei]TJZ52532.1 hypothetical protein FAZ15_19280 [Sphingobacterium olei]
MELFEDIAIPLSWPDQTARGDEAWMGFFKKIGVVKNLNFKVGHAAILLLERHSGDILYYDFGRYIAPRGYGRARSSAFDPRLVVRTKALWDVNNNLLNLEEILCELSQNEKYTHGGGRLYCSIAEDINIKNARLYADEIVNKGPTLYGAIAPNNNSCSRYVAQILTKGMNLNDSRTKSILYPECLKASPTSNVINANKKGEVFVYYENTLRNAKMTRKESLLFQIDLLKDSLYTSRAAKIKDDSRPGLIDEPPRPAHIPKNATWLGGIGEGIWLHLTSQEGIFEIVRYHHSGEIDYKVSVICNQQIDLEKPYTFTFHFNYHYYNVYQDNNIYLFKSLDTHINTIKNKAI